MEHGNKSELQTKQIQWMLRPQRFSCHLHSWSCAHRWDCMIIIINTMQMVCPFVCAEMRFTESISMLIKATTSFRIKFNYAATFGSHNNQTFFCGIVANRVEQTNAPDTALILQYRRVNLAENELNARRIAARGAAALLVAAFIYSFGMMKVPFIGWRIHSFQEPVAICFRSAPLFRALGVRDRNLENSIRNNAQL